MWRGRGGPFSGFQSLLTGVTSMFEALIDELNQWSEPPTFWWRDDDAIQVTKQLRALLDISAPVPLTLAVIPGLVQQDLAPWLAGHDPDHRITVVPHGWVHQNHAHPPAKKRELTAAFDQAAAARSWQVISHAFGSRAVPIMVPPWNRIDTKVLAALKAAEFIGVSTYGQTLMDRTHALPVINSHVDVLDWSKRTGPTHVPSHVPEKIIKDIMDALAMRRVSGRHDPLGLLTHHLVQDAETNAFLKTLIQTVLTPQRVTWVPLLHLASDLLQTR